MKWFGRKAVVWMAAAWMLVGGTVQAADTAALVQRLRGVKADGKSQSDAALAWRELSALDASQLPAVLAEFQNLEPLAANWLRSAIDAIGERAVNEGKPLPTKELEAFVLDTSHDPRGRRLAYEWLLKGDKAAADRIIPGRLNDPSVDLRRDAVALVIADAHAARDAGQSAKAVELYQKALAAARDPEQVKVIVEQLRKNGVTVDLPTHFGFITHWKVIGPFDNVGGKGFEAVYPPEKEQSFDKPVMGKNGEVSWKEITTNHDYGMVDLNQKIGKNMGAVGYAHTEFYSDRDRPAEIRLGSKNAWKVWLNGEYLFGRDEYHRGMRMDQYQMRCKLKEGRNEILVKCCQNEQTDSWAQEWEFQLRVCDEIGTAILSTRRPAQVAGRNEGKQ